MKDSKNVDNFDLTADRQFLTHSKIIIYLKLFHKKYFYFYYIISPLLI